jgi:hypothetical protein
MAYNKMFLEFFFRQKFLKKIFGRYPPISGPNISGPTPKFCSVDFLALVLSFPKRYDTPL